MSFTMSTAPVATVSLPGSAGSDVPSTASAWLTPVELLLLGAIWGASFLFQRVAAKDFGSFALVEVRLFLGALVLMPFLIRARSQFNLRSLAATRRDRRHQLGNSVRVVCVGCPTCSGGYWCNSERDCGDVHSACRPGFLRGIHQCPAHDGIDRRLCRRSGSGEWKDQRGQRVASSARGNGGFSVVWNWREFDSSPIGWPAGRCRGGGYFVLRICIHFAVGAGYLAVDADSRDCLGCARFCIGVVCTGIAYALYYRLINRIGAPRASTVTYLVPLFGVLWAWLALGEPLTVTMAIAGALILGGVA